MFMQSPISDIFHIDTYQFVLILVDTAGFGLFEFTFEVKKWLKERYDKTRDR